METSTKYLSGFEPKFDHTKIVLTIPQKATCTVSEAAKCLGMSERQVRYWIADGTLLAINSAREPISGARKKTKQDRWRVVVRRSPETSGEEAKAFYTLAELLPRITNQIAE